MTEDEQRTADVRIKLFRELLQGGLGVIAMVSLIGAGGFMLTHWVSTDAERLKIEHERLLTEKERAEGFELMSKGLEKNTDAFRQLAESIDSNGAASLATEKKMAELIEEDVRGRELMHKDFVELLKKLIKDPG